MNIELFANLPKYLHRHCALTDKLDKRLAEILHLQKAPIPNSLSPLMSASVSHGKLSRAGTKLTYLSDWVTSHNPFSIEFVWIIGCDMHLIL